MEAIQTDNHIEQELKKFSPIESAIAEYRDQYLPLKINGVDDREGYKRVHDARMVIKNKRVSVDKMRLAMNAEAQTFIKAVNAKAKEITSLLEPIETHLDNEETAIDNEKARIVAERLAEEERIRKEAEEAEMRRVQQRLNMLNQYGFHADYTRVKSMSDVEFEKELAEAKAYQQEELRQRAEAERKAKEEAERLAAERAELERLRQEQAQREAALKAEQLRIQQEQEERERKIREAREAIDRQKREAEEKARRDAEEAARIEAEQKRLAEAAEAARLKAIEDARIEQERKDKEEADRKAEEARQAALRPDKEKLLELANRIVATPLPELQSDGSKAVLSEVQDLLNKIQFHIVKRAKSL